tara:strand:- start:273 stop:824 length:552 start_codon:yes stop_codon:yes gene_type:complete
MAFPKTTGSYKIKKGDTLSGIAKARGTTVAKIMKMNPMIKDKNKIRAGAGLRLPPKPIKATAKDKAKAARGLKDLRTIFSPTQIQQVKRAILKEQAAAQKKMASKKRGGVMKAAGGKMAKGYSKGGARRMMTAMGGKMAKGYSKGGARMMRAMGGKMAKGNSRMNLTMLRRAAGGMGYKLTKK